MVRLGHRVGWTKLKLIQAFTEIWLYFVWLHLYNLLPPFFYLHSRTQRRHKEHMSLFWCWVTPSKHRKTSPKSIFWCTLFLAWFLVHLSRLLLRNLQYIVVKVVFLFCLLKLEVIEWSAIICAEQFSQSFSDIFYCNQVFRCICYVWYRTLITLIFLFLRISCSFLAFHPSRYNLICCQLGTSLSFPSFCIFWIYIIRSKFKLQKNTYVISIHKYNHFNSSTSMIIGLTGP